MLRRSAARIGARIASSGLQAATLILLARALGPTEFGHFAVGLSLGYVVSAVLAWGGPTWVLRASAEARPDELRASLAVVQVVSLGMLLLVAVVLHLLGAIDLASTAGFAVGLSDQINTFAQNEAAGRGAHARASALALQQRAIPALTVLLTLAQFQWPVFLAAVALASAIPVSSSLRALRHARPRQTEIRGGAGYWAYGLIQASPQLEAPVVSAVADAAVAGMYGIANRVATPLTILSSALASIFIPEIAATTEKERRRALGRRLIAISSGYAALVALSAVWIAPVVVLIVGEQFRAAEPLIAATTVAAGLSAVSQAINAVMLAAGRPFASTWTLAAGTVVSLVGLGTLSSFEQARFLWLAPLMTQVVVLALFTVLLRRSPSTGGTPVGVDIGVASAIGDDSARV